MVLAVLRPDEFISARWKNGGGITHEIAKAEDAAGLIWRLSIAEVASDGPFSAFSGLSRILTVIEGAGLILETPDGPLNAEPFKPLAFSGGLAVTSRMLDGPIRDFNVIYDALRINAEVSILADQEATLSADKSETLAVFCANGAVALEGCDLARGHVAMIQGHKTRIKVGKHAVALVVRLSPV